MKAKGFSEIIHEYHEHLISVMFAFLMYFIIHYIIEPFINTSIPLLTHICMDALFGTLLFVILKKRESSQNSLKELNDSTKLLQNSIEQKSDAAILSQKITNNYYKVITI